MKNIIDLIKNFFSSKHIKFSINRPKDEVIAKFKELISSKNNFLWNNADLSGYCDNNEFALSLVSPAYIRGAKFSSTIFGKIKEKDTATEIDIFIKRSFTIYGLFFISQFLGIISLIIFLSNPNSFKYIFWGIALLIGGPYFAIWFSNVSNNNLQERFENFIKKEFN